MALKRLLVVALLLLASCASARDDVCFGDACVTVEIAATADEQSRGLMFRGSLPAAEGMLFRFAQEGTHQFWMKNTLIPLDILWMDAQGRIVHIETARPCEAEPCPSFGPTAPTRYVLEVNAGWAEAHGVAVGDIARLP